MTVSADQLKQTVETRVKQYVAIRDEIKRIEDAHEAYIKEHKDTLAALGGWLQTFLDAAKATSIKTDCGTVYTSTRHTASLADADAFMKFVISSGKFELLDRRANATAVKDYVKETGGLPPGANLSAMVTIGVRRK